MMKKITAGVIALVMMFGSGVWQKLDILPETAMNASASEKEIDEIMGELEIGLTFVNGSGARYVVFGEMTKDVTHETQGFYDRKYTFVIKGDDLYRAMDGDFSEMIDKYTFSAEAHSDEYESVKLGSAFVEGVIHYRSGASRLYYTVDTGEEVLYLPAAVKLEYEDPGFSGNFYVMEKMYRYALEEIEDIVIEYWINTSSFEAVRKPVKDNNSSSVPEDISSEAGESSSVTEDTSSEAKESSAVIEDTSSEAEESSSVIEDTSSEAEESSSVIEDTSSEAEESSSVIEDTSSEAGESSSRPDEDEPVLLGDVNADGVIDIADAVVIVNHINGVTPLVGLAEKAADADLNGEIDIRDAVALINHINGIKSLD